MIATRGSSSVAVAAMLAVTLGCGSKQHSILQPNQPPEVELFAQHSSGASAGEIAYRFSWAGHDPDGQVDHYLAAWGAPGDDDANQSWERTTDRDRIVSFARTTAPRDSAASASVEPRVFSIRAVDGGGIPSATRRISVFEDNVAPIVWITSPRPSLLALTYVRSTVCIEWTGVDYDGYNTQVPVKYKYTVLTSSTEMTLQTALSFPDTVRKYYAPRKWAGWDSTGSRGTSVVLNNLVPGTDYLFVITCFDELGAYCTTFSRDATMLYMRASFASTQLPTLGMFNEYFSYTYPTGTFDPSRAITLDVPGNQPITFNWFAFSQNGTAINSYRWAVDIADIADDTPRSNETTDLAHWSHWSLLTTSATLPPFLPSGSTHRLYIEARQEAICGLSTLPGLGVIQFTVVQPTFSHELLFVDDTRLRVDQIQPGTTCDNFANRPIGAWPTAAELDTFLFARGWVPWRCYPSGSVSRPGIFSGYDFDTIGTRGVPGAVPLSTLSNYRHVVWYVDGNAAAKPNAPDHFSDPGTSLRFMSAANQQSTLAAYVAQGGKVWLAGGGGGGATILPWDRSNNNFPYTTFSNANNELVPGRFMYDMAHWRSEFARTRAQIQLNRSLGRFTSSPGIYANLPTVMQPKSLAAGDTFPPNRTVNGGDFYQTSFDIEFLDQANSITENVNPGFDLQSTLDTLMAAVGAALPPVGNINACMTYYHGLDNAAVIFSGFNFWNYRRTQCIQLVDFVLQQLWGLPRDPVNRGPSAIVTVDPRLPVGRLGRPAAETARAAPPGAAARE